MSGDSTDRFLPDFLDPDDVSDDSFAASQYWGSESPMPAVEAEVSSAEESSSHGSFGARKKPSSFGDSSRRTNLAGRKRPKKYLTWEEKQQRKEKRAAARADQDAAERAHDPFAHAREIALSYLSSAPRTRNQLFDRLSERSVDETVALAVIDRLEKVGLVNDDEYARMLVRTRVASRGLARRGLEQELARKGLSGEVVQNALETITADDEFATARALVEKKLRTMSRLEPDVQKRRLAGMLARKGYGPQIIWPLLREVIDDEAGSDEM